MAQVEKIELLHSSTPRLDLSQKDVIALFAR